MIRRVLPSRIIYTPFYGGNLFIQESYSFEIPNEVTLSNNLTATMRTIFYHYCEKSSFRKLSNLKIPHDFVLNWRKMMNVLIFHPVKWVSLHRNLYFRRIWWTSCNDGHELLHESSIGQMVHFFLWRWRKLIFSIQWAKAKRGLEIEFIYLLIESDYSFLFCSRFCSSMICCGSFSTSAHTAHTAHIETFWVAFERVRADIEPIWFADRDHF